MAGKLNKIPRPFTPWGINTPLLDDLNIGEKVSTLEIDFSIKDRAKTRHLILTCLEVA